MRILRAIAFLPLSLARARQAVEIRVDGEVRQGPFRPIFSYWLEAKDGKVEIRFPLPRHAVSLVRLSW